MTFNSAPKTFGEGAAGPGFHPDSRKGEEQNESYHPHSLSSSFKNHPLQNNTYSWHVHISLSRDLLAYLAILFRRTFDSQNLNQVQGQIFLKDQIIKKNSPLCFGMKYQAPDFAGE